MPDSEIPRQTQPVDPRIALGKIAPTDNADLESGVDGHPYDLEGAAKTPGGKVGRRAVGHSSAEPFSAPLPSMRQDFRPGIWVEPEAPTTRREEEMERGAWAPPPLPRGTHKQSHGTLISFIIAVMLPTLLLAGYYYLLAEDEYYSEFRFSVSVGNPVLPGAIPRRWLRARSVKASPAPRFSSCRRFSAPGRQYQAPRRRTSS